MPGVPGIGVKTAAQLIGEYGDLETLLARAGEIKQEKRRQTLIDNAEKARLSKKLVTLDDKVKLDVPLADLAVHEPDYKLLIAFLKAMEFTTLTRRVAEFAGIDAGEIDADRRPASRSRERSAVASPRCDRRQSPGLPLHRRRHDGEAAPGRRRDRADPDHAAGARGRARSKPRARSRSTARATRSCSDARPAQGTGSRARSDLGVVAINTETHRRRSDAGDAVRHRARGRAERGLLRAARASQGRQRRRGLFGGGLAPDQISETDALAALKPLLEDASVLKIGAEPEIRIADVRACAASRCARTRTPC